MYLDKIKTNSNQQKMKKRTSMSTKPELKLLITINKEIPSGCGTAINTMNNRESKPQNNSVTIKVTPLLEC